MERGRVSFPEYGSTGTPVLSGLMKTSETEDMSMYIAKTYHGLEPVLAQELKELGATGIRISNRAVLFDCTQEVLYKANYLCRTALRILKILKEFWIEKEEDLFEQVHEMAWEKVFPVDATFMVDSSSLDSMFSQSRFVSTQARLAILERFRRVLGQWPDVDSDYYTIRVEVFVRQNHCEVMLDASGMALAHRGYRKPSSEPFNEVLAAGLLKLAQWNPDTDLYVPFCGNGLVAVEAAMQAMAMPVSSTQSKYTSLIALISFKQGLHQVAQKLIIIGWPSFSNSEVLICLPLKSFTVTEGSCWANAKQALIIKAANKTIFFILSEILVSITKGRSPWSRCKPDIPRNDSGESRPRNIRTPPPAGLQTYEFLRKFNNSPLKETSPVQNQAERFCGA